MRRWNRETNGVDIHVKLLVLKRVQMQLLLLLYDTQKTVRGFQRLLRTNLQNLGVELPSKQNGWLSLLTLDEATEVLAHYTKPAKPYNNEYHPITLKMPVNLLKMR